MSKNKSKHKFIASIDAYAHRSPLKQWNSKLKMVFTLLVLIYCIAADSPIIFVYIILTMSAGNIFLNRIVCWDYVRVMTAPLVFILLGSIAIALDIGTGSAGWYIKITADGLLKSFEVTARALGAAGGLYFLTLSTPVNEIISVLRSCRVPKLVIELMYLIYRYIFILGDAQLRIRAAAESRLGYVDFKTSCYTFGSSMGNLFIVSLKKSGIYYDAMVSRCYDGDLLFWEEEKPVEVKHMLWAGLYMASLVAISFWIQNRV